MKNSIKENIQNILNTIRAEEEKSKREKDSVKLLAVSKFHSKEEIEQAINSGLISFGENRVQEAFEKFSYLKEKYPQIDLHIIGSLQSNKVKKAVQIASVIESVDRISLIQDIEKYASQQNKTIKILLEFHTAEDSKSGFKTEEEIQDALLFCKENCSHVVPVGFMTMAPFTENTLAIRKSFSTLKELSFKMQQIFPQFSLTELSMGMSGDYKIAIEEGSTQVRIGTAIFGERNYGTV